MSPRINAAKIAFLKKENICFFCISFFVWSTMSLYSGFMMAFLTSKGYSALEAGVINCIGCVVSICFEPLVGYITDTFLSMKKYLVLTCLGAIATTCLLPLLADSFPLAVLSAFIYFLFSTPISHLMDTWVVTLRDERPYIDYGKTRFGGSLGYAIMAAAAGWLISLFSSYMVLYISAMMTLGLVIVFMIPIPDIPCKNAGKRKEETHSDTLPFQKALKVLLHNKTYLLFLFSALGFNIALRPFSMNAAYKVMELGGTDSDLGIALAVAAVAECPLLFVISHFTKRYKLSWLYLVCIGATVIRGLMFGLAPNFTVFLISQLLHAVSNGTYIVVCLEIVRAVVPEKVRATGITLMVGFSSGVGGIVGTVGSGAMIDLFGVAWMSAILVGVVLVSAMIYFLPMLSAYRKNPELLI